MSGRRGLHESCFGLRRTCGGVFCHTASLTATLFYFFSKKPQRTANGCPERLLIKLFVCARRAHVRESISLWASSLNMFGLLGCSSPPPILMGPVTSSAVSARKRHGFFIYELFFEWLRQGSSVKTRQKQC
ncbi:hypothetical protein CEXT_613861 [Caerostris extrusa]|uniref:Uncharacterized protein n=1 Tax=Caerostris extrusa TaxID=172846 RepID=A0AAV4NC68_CAEEX|nr:hypothetical protein CEXT_613861 [Caerostris extrusa]